VSFRELVSEFIFSKKGDSPSLLARKNDLALRIAIIFIILAVPYVVIFRYLHMGEIEAMVIATIGFLSLSIVFNRLKAYSISKALLVMGPTLTFFGTANILGPEAGAQFLLFTLVALPLFLFEITQVVWIVFCMMVPISAHIALELGHYDWISHGAYLDPKILLYIRCFVILTTFLLLVLSGGAYFLSNRRYELKLEEKNQELESKNTDLQTAYTRLDTQKTLLKRRITAIHTMTESCRTIPEWEGICIQIFRHHLNMTPLVWVPDAAEKLSLESMSEHLPICALQAQTLLQRTGCFAWSDSGVSVLLPLVSGPMLMGLIGLAPNEVLSDDDLDFAVMVAKELQKTLHLIRSTEAMKTLNVVEFVQKNEALFRELNITDRELEIIGLLVQGVSNATISSMLVVTESTTKRHVYNIFRKLKISSRFELMKWMNAHVVAGLENPPRSPS
jgi:DNA-binding CsgD family transcriptional regulator